MTTAVASLALGVVTAAAQTVATRAGKVEGSAEGGVTRFLGIPS